MLFRLVLLIVLLGASRLGSAAPDPDNSGLFTRPDTAAPVSDVAGVTDPGEPVSTAAGTRQYRAIRVRVVHIDIEKIQSLRQDILGPEGSTTQTLNLFDDAAFEAIFEQVVPARSGFALHGRLAGVESGTATLVARGAVVTGTVHTPIASYTIRPLADGLHEIAEVDPTRPDDGPLPPEDAPVDFFEEASEPRPRGRNRSSNLVAPGIDAAPTIQPAAPPLPSVGHNPWQPQGPGARGRKGGLFDGQVDNVEPNNAVIGAIHTLLAHPSNADILYIGATNGGVWKTTNATAEDPDWVPLTDDMGSLSIGAMAFDPANPEIVLVGIGRASSYGLRGGDRNGLLLTRDGGENWTRIDPPALIDMNVSGVSISGDRLLVAGNGYTVFTAHRGVLLSDDGGATWSAIAGEDGLPPLRGVFDLVDDPTDPDRFYVSVQFVGIFRSDDGGASWTHVSAGDETIQAAMTDFSNNNAEMAVARNGRVYLAVMVGGQAHYIGFTDDQGGTWTGMDLPQTPESDGDIEGLNPRFKPGAQGYIHFSIRADPTDPDIVYVGGDRQDTPFPNYIGARNFTGRLFRGNADVSPTGEVPSPQWDHLTHSAFISGIPEGGTRSNSSPHADSREMAFDAAGDLIEVDDGGIYRRTSPRDNSGDWFSLNGNLQITEMHDVAYDTLSNVIVSGNQDVGTSGQSAANSLYWDSVIDGDGGDVVIDVSDAPAQSVRYLSAQYLRAFRRLVYDAENRLLEASFPRLLVQGDVPLPSWDPGLQFVQRFELNAADPGRAVLGASALYETFDDFETLVEAFVPDRELDPFDRVRATGVGCPGNPALLYVGHGSRAPRVSVRRSEPLDSSDGFEATEYPGASPVDLVINPDDCETVYVIDTRQVWSSHDSGATWQEITGNLTEVPVRYPNLRTLEFVPAGEVFREAAIAVGGRGGVQVMDVTREGEWYDLGGELPDVPVFDLDYDLQDRVLVAGTLGRGAWLVLSSAPILLGVIGEQVLEIGDDVDLDVSALFYSIQGTLTYTVESSDPSVASATVAGTDVSVTTLRAGAVTITITATDGDGLTGTYTFTATVGTVASFDAAPDPVPEGAAVTLTIKLNRAVESTIDIDYTVVPGDDADTAGADDRDHDLNAGTLSFAPGDTSGVIDIAINDDDEIEPVREAFTVQLQAPDNEAWGIGLVSAVTVRINEGVCDRTPEIRDAIRRGEPCAGVSELDMASIHSLELEALGIVDLQSLDLLGLHALTRLELLNNPLTTLPEGLLGGLSRLTTLEIAHNRLQTLPGNLFGDVPRLLTLNLHENRLQTLAEGTFDGLVALNRLNLTGNMLAALPATVFDGLTGLKVLHLNRNQLTELPAGVFDELVELNILDLGENLLGALPERVFDSLKEVNALFLHNNKITALPEDTFGGLDNLGLLWLSQNDLGELPAGVFADLDLLDRLYLDGNQLRALPPGLFAGMELDLLHLHGNPGAPFTLELQPVRTDTADLHAPGPAAVAATVVEGAPFPMQARVAAKGGALSADTLEIPVGGTLSNTIAVEETGGKSMIELLDVSPVPALRCRSVPCFQGIRTAAGDPIWLFPGPGITQPITDQLVDPGSPSLTVDLADVFSADPGTTLTFSVVTSDAALVGVSLVGSILTITPDPDADEGEATLTVTATDSNGISSTLSFTVTVGLPASGLRGWRLAVLAEAAAKESTDVTESE